MVKMFVEPPYDRGFPWSAWVNGEKFTVSAETANKLIELGVPVDYMGFNEDYSPAHQATKYATEETIKSVQEAINNGSPKVSKKLAKVLTNPCQ